MLFDFLFVEKKKIGPYTVYWNERTGEWSANVSFETIWELFESGTLSRSETSYLSSTIEAPYVKNRQWGTGIARRYRYESH